MSSVTASQLIETKQVISGLIGAVLALLGQWLVRRASRAVTARRLALAFWEELSATHFYGPPDKPNFAGLSSQTFDTLFREVAATLPESLARDLMRYHWRMKYMEEMKPVTIPSSGGVDRQFWQEAKELHTGLIDRLERYSRRRTLFVRLAETGTKQLPGAGST